MQQLCPQDLKCVAPINSYSGSVGCFAISDFAQPFAQIGRGLLLHLARSIKDSLTTIRNNQPQNSPWPAY
jgi:hypothetical protein